MSGTFFPFVGAFVWISILLIVGVFLRSKISFLQHKLIPSALIGGIIGFFLMNAGLVGMPTAEGWKEIPPKAFGTLVYHLFAFGFVGIGLMEQVKSTKTGSTNWIRSGALWMALIYCLVYAVQALTGKATFEILSLFSSENIFSGFGYLVGTGFAQNPGAGQAMGMIWENQYGITGAGSVGLAFGAMGFLTAIAIGIPFVNKGIRNGWADDEDAGKLPKALLVGMMDKGEATPCANSTTHSSNVDSLAFHLGVMFVLYIVGYLFALFWNVNMPKGIAGLGFGLLYAWGMIAAIIVKSLLKKMDKIHIIDADTVRRITGTTVDFMICAVFMGITIGDIQAIFIPFITTVVLAGIVTYFVVIWFARRLPDSGFERGIATFGCYTGTVASGLLLLRIVDPKFKSPAAVELAIMNVFILPIVQLIYINLPFVPSEGSLMLPIFIAYVIAMPIALFALGFVKKRNW